MPDESDPLTPRASTPPPGFSGAPQSSSAPSNTSTSRHASISASTTPDVASAAVAREQSGTAQTVELAPDTWVGVLAMALMILGSFGPWATAAGVSVSALGHGGNAIITLIAGVVLLLPVVRNRYPGLAIAAGLVAIGVAYHDGLDISSIGDGIAEVSIGWGLFATGAGGMIALAWGLRRVLRLREQESA